MVISIQTRTLPHNPILTAHGQKAFLDGSDVSPQREMTVFIISSCSETACQLWDPLSLGGQGAEGVRLWQHWGDVSDL